jgi:hypothetical protein
MNKFFLVIPLLFSTTLINAQRFDWVSFTPIASGSINGASGNLCVTTDNEGNIYTVSVFNNQIIVGNDTLLHTGNLGRPDLLLTKWSANGEPINYRHMANLSNNGNPEPQEMIFDSQKGEILLTISSFTTIPLPLLHLWGNSVESDTTLTLGPGAVLRFNKNLGFVSNKIIPGNMTYKTCTFLKDGFLYSAQGYSSTIAKTDSLGNVVWSKTATGPNGFSVRDLIVTNDDMIYLIGYYMGSGLFNAPLVLDGTSVLPPTAGNNTHSVIFKLDTAGNVLQGKYFAEVRNNLNICSDANSNIYIACGYSVGGQSLGNFTLSNPTVASDGFIAKLNSNLDIEWVKELHHTGGNMEMNDIIYTEGKISVIGLYGNTAQFGNFSLDHAQSGSCYIVQMNDATGNIEYATNFGNLAGTGRPHSFSRFNNKFYIGGLSYGTTLSEAKYGCYTHSKACAFLTSFTDTIFPALNVSLSYNAPVLQAVNNAGLASFEWFLNGQLIPNQSSSTIVPSENGQYVVVINAHGCTASDTLEVLNIGIEKEHETNAKYKVFPNPADNIVSLSGITEDSFISVYDSKGKLIFQEYKLNPDYTINTSGFQSGLYLVKIESLLSSVNIKLIVTH